MLETTTAELARDFGSYLAKVEQGESVLIREGGRKVARLVPETEFLGGEQFAKLFERYKPDALDKAAADEIEKNIIQINQEAESDLAH
jgi:antitoxin (DNA-binding transcriptional repressor) of toxin-antitoxin stability system